MRKAWRAWRHRWLAVEGNELSQDEWRVYQLWEGKSVLGAIRAVRAAAKSGMNAVVRVYLPE